MIVKIGNKEEVKFNINAKKKSLIDLFFMFNSAPNGFFASACWSVAHCYGNDAEQPLTEVGRKANGKYTILHVPTKPTNLPAFQLTNQLANQPTFKMTDQFCLNDYLRSDIIGSAMQGV